MTKKIDKDVVAGPETPGSAPVPMEPVTIAIRTGPLHLRAELDFDPWVLLDVPDKEKFVLAVRTCVGRANAVGVRLVELMLLGAAARMDVSAPLLGCTNDLKIMVEALEFFMDKVVKGQDPSTGVEVATAGTPLPPPPSARGSASQGR